MKYWDKILDDFARKCKGGSPDMTNPRHLALLRESLIKFGWKENAANEILGNLREVACGVGQNPEDTGCEPASGGSGKDGEADQSTITPDFTDDDTKITKEFTRHKVSLSSEDIKKSESYKKPEDVSYDQSERQEHGRDTVKKHGLEGIHILADQTTEFYENMPEDTTTDAGGKEIKHKWNMGGAGASFGEAKTTDVSNRIARGEIPPPNTVEEYIEQEKKRLKGSRIEKELGETGLETWLRIAYEGGVDQVRQVDEIIDRNGNPNGQPDGLPAYCQMNPEGEAALHQLLDDRIAKCGDDTCRKHYIKQKYRLKKRKDTDTYSVYEDKNGNLAVVKITNKQGLNDMRYNTTMAKRIENLRISAQDVISDIFELAPEDVESASHQLISEVNETDQRAIDIANDGNRAFNIDARRRIDKRGGSQQVAKGIPKSVLKGLIGRSSTDISKSDDYRKNAGNNPVVQDLVKELYPGKSWDDLDEEQQMHVVLESSGRDQKTLEKIYEKNNPKPKSNGTKTREKEIEAWEKRKKKYVEASLGYGDSSIGGAGKMTYKIFETTADIRSKLTTRLGNRKEIKKLWQTEVKTWIKENYPDGPPKKGDPGYEEYSESKKSVTAKARTKAIEKFKKDNPKEFEKALKEEAESYSKKPDKDGNLPNGGQIKASDMVDIFNNDDLRDLENSRNARKEALEAAHAAKVEGLSKADRNFVRNNIPEHADKSDEEIDKILEENPHLRAATDTYARNFMNEIHWTDYINQEDDNDVIANIGGRAYVASDYRNSLTAATGYPPEGETFTNQGLIHHIQDGIQLESDEFGVLFMNGETEVILGIDTHRTAGGAQKLEGKDGKVIQYGLVTSHRERTK